MMIIYYKYIHFILTNGLGNVILGTADREKVQKGKANARGNNKYDRTGISGKNAQTGAKK